MNENIDTKEKALILLLQEAEDVFNSEPKRVFRSIRLILELSLKIAVKEIHPTIDTYSRSLSELIPLITDSPKFDRKFSSFLRDYKHIGNLDTHWDASEFDLRKLNAKNELYLYLKWFFEKFLNKELPDFIKIWPHKNEQKVKEPETKINSETKPPPQIFRFNKNGIHKDFEDISDLGFKLKIKKNSIIIYKKYSRIIINLTNHTISESYFPGTGKKIFYRKEIEKVIGSDRYHWQKPFGLNTPDTIFQISLTYHSRNKFMFSFLIPYEHKDIRKSMLEKFISYEFEIKRILSKNEFAKFYKFARYLIAYMCDCNVNMIFEENKQFPEPNKSGNYPNYPQPRFYLSLTNKDYLSNLTK